MLFNDVIIYRQLPSRALHCGILTKCLSLSSHGLTRQRRRCLCGWQSSLSLVTRTDTPMPQLTEHALHDVVSFRQVDVEGESVPGDRAVSTMCQHVINDSLFYCLNLCKYRFTRPIKCSNGRRTRCRANSRCKSRSCKHPRVTD